MRLFQRLFGILLVTILISILALAGCGQTAPGTSTPAPTTTTESKYGGTLKIIHPYPITNIGNPVRGLSGYDHVMALPAIEYLLRCDEKGNILPWLITSWQFSPDGKSLNCKLQQGVKFHDGTPFNADAVKYIMDLCKEKGTGIDGITSISSIDIIDDYTVRFTFKAYDAAFLYGLAYMIVASPTAIKANGLDWCLMNPVGTGPFKLVSNQRDVSLKYTKFVDYWQKGKPYLDGVEYTFVADVTSGMLLWKGGGYNVLSGQYSGPDVLAFEKPGYIFNRVTTGTIGLVSNSIDPKSPFADVRVRQAVSFAIDPAGIEKLGNSFYMASQTPVPKNHSAYTPVTGYPYNPQKAKELLAQAGYPNGFKTQITCSAPPAEIWIAMQRYLQVVGIDAEINAVQGVRFSELRDTAKDGWGGLINFSMPFSTGMDPNQCFIRATSKLGRRYTFGMIHPDEYEAKLAQAQVERDMSKRNTLIQEATKLLVDKYCLVNIFCINGGAFVLTGDIQDANFYYPVATTWMPEQTWIKK